MIFVIHNNTTGQIEGAYMSALYAEIMMTNLKQYYKGKFQFSLETIKTPQNRPTTTQLREIEYIRLKTLKRFTGITYDAAKKFILENS